MERVYLIEDGLGYGERFVLAYLSTRMSRDRSFMFEGTGGLAEELEVSQKVLSSLLRSLEEKGYIKLDRKWTGERLITTSAKLKLKNGKWIKVPRSFLYAGHPKERGLLLTIAGNYKPVGFGDRKLKKTAFFLKEWTSHDVRSVNTLRKLLMSLQSRGFILIERTRPFYVVRVVM